MHGEQPTNWETALKDTEEMRKRTDKWGFGGMGKGKGKRGADLRETEKEEIGLINGLCSRVAWLGWFNFISPPNTRRTGDLGGGGTGGGGEGKGEGEEGKGWEDAGRAGKARKGKHISRELVGVGLRERDRKGGGGEGERHSERVDGRGWV